MLRGTIIHKNNKIMLGAWSDFMSFVLVIISLKKFQVGSQSDNQPEKLLSSSNLLYAFLYLQQLEHHIEL